MAIAILMPLMGMSHSLSKGAKRFVDGINDESLVSGKFYASSMKKLVTMAIVIGAIAVAAQVLMKRR